jgi:hypothetical protein
MGRKMEFVGWGRDVFWQSSIEGARKSMFVSFRVALT